MSHRTTDQVKVAELLVKAKDALGLSLTFLSRMDGETQHLEVVESSIPLFRDGQTQRQETSFCQAILDGRLPNVIPNVAKLPEAKRLPAARFPRIRSFVSVPVTFSDGTVYGTFCAAGFLSDNQLSSRVPTPDREAGDDLETERWRLFEAVCELVAGLGAARRACSSWTTSIGQIERPCSSCVTWYEWRPDRLWCWARSVTPTSHPIIPWRRCSRSCRQTRQRIASS